jgi:hypothetical protein
MEGKLVFCIFLEALEVLVMGLGQQELPLGKVLHLRDDEGGKKGRRGEERKREGGEGGEG